MKDKLKIILGLIMGIALFALICKGLNYIYVSYDPWYRMVFQSYYDQDNIDNVFLGSSVVYFGVDPTVLDELNGQDNFNMSTPGQRWDTTYYLLREVISDHKPDNVYLECYCYCLGEYELWDDKTKSFRPFDYIDDPENIARPWLITYEMKPSVNRELIHLSCFETEHLLDTLFPFIRYRANLFDWEAIRKNIDDKTSDGYINTSFNESDMDVDGSTYRIEYEDKGHFYSDGRLYDLEKCVEQTRVFSSYGIGPESEEYLRKSIELCKANGIGVKLFVAPIYDLQLISTVDYDGYLNELKQISEETEVELYDFNLIRDEYLDIKDDRYYLDPVHLNESGANMFTPVLWDVLKSTQEENSCKFHDSYTAKLSDEPPEIYGLFHRDINPVEDANTVGCPVYSTRHYTIASNRDMEYRISYSFLSENTTDDYQIVVVQDYDKNNEFDIPVGLSGQIGIKGRYGSEEYSIVVYFE
jgi:hypothetical protein